MSGPETVVILHGLWMHGLAMAGIKRRIARHGYRAVCYSYPSMRLGLTENADRLATFCRSLDAPKIHFVGHSLGGLVVLTMAERSPDARIGRIVLLGSPCGESHAGRRLARLPGGAACLGKSIVEWRAHPRTETLRPYEIGVVAGSLPLGLGRLIAPDLERPNDGVVCVTETRLPEMRDHVVVGTNHFGMLLSREVAHQACEFIRHGRFAAGGGNA